MNHMILVLTFISLRRPFAQINPLPLIHHKGKNRLPVGDSFSRTLYIASKTAVGLTFKIHRGSPSSSHP